MIQLTLIQLDNYGPWTVTPSPKREADLQILQSNIYSDLQKLFSLHKAIVFPFRYDNLIAVTNGVGKGEHERILKTINTRYPVTISMSIASAPTSLEAEKKASMFLSRLGSAQSSKRKAELVIGDLSDDLVRMAHIDIDSVTKHTDNDVYTSFQYILTTHHELSRKLEEKGALLFYMGGDNFISPCTTLDENEFKKIFQEVSAKAGISLKAGIGEAKNAEEAIHLASIALSEIRAGSSSKIIYKNSHG